MTEGLGENVQETLIDALVHMKAKLVMEAETPLRVAGE